MCADHAKMDLGFTYENYPPGTHMCLIYSSEEERTKIISRFLESGLKSGDKVGYFTDKTSSEEVTNWLLEKGIELPDPKKSSQLTITSTADTYFPKGRFVPDDTLEMLRTYYIDARDENFQSVRIIGEMSWALKGIPGSEKLMEYEAKANEVFKHFPITAICQYDANKFDGATILECLKVHPYMIVRGQIVKNPFYIKTEAYLKTLSE